MVDVFLDPRLEDYFVEHDWAELAIDDSARDQVFEDFLSQRISVIHGLDMEEIDFPFLETVRFPQTWAMKKFQFAEIVSEVRAGRKSEGGDILLHDTFNGDMRRFAKFIDQLEIIIGVAHKAINRLLGHLVIDETLMVARFSETRMENLHYDLDANSDDHEGVRLYINLDAYPRIWATSYQVTTLLERGGRRLLDGIDPNDKSEMILKRAATRAYGGWHHRATERQSPRHLIYFDPGDVWIVDGRSVSHQVLSGHRVLSVLVKIPHSSNPDIAATFAGKVRESLKRGMEMPLGCETAEVGYFSPSEIGSAANLREDWAQVFGETRTGRIRRFNDSGMVPTTRSLKHGEN